MLIPVNDRSLVPLPAGTQAAFQAHLARTIVAAWSAPLPSTDVDGDEAPPSAPEDRACGVCAGACCPAGGTTAFLSAERLAVIRQQLLRSGRVLDADALQGEYLAHLPALHYEGSCVYHAVGGCTLPRVLRSSLCNRYRCGGLTQLTRAFTTDPRQTVFVAAAGTDGLRRVARIDADGVVPVWATEPVTDQRF